NNGAPADDQIVERADRDRRDACELPSVGRSWQAGEHLIEDPHRAEPESRVHDVPDTDELGHREAVSRREMLGWSWPSGPGIGDQRYCTKRGQKGATARTSAQGRFFSCSGWRAIRWIAHACSHRPVWRGVVAKWRRLVHAVNHTDCIELCRASVLIRRIDG